MQAKHALMIVWILFPAVTLADLPVNGDFETVRTVPAGMPSGGEPIPGLDVWYGSPATIVSAEGNIMPATGDHMLRFDGTVSGIYQLVNTPQDLRGTYQRFEAAFNSTSKYSPEYQIGFASISNTLVAGSVYPDHLGWHIALTDVDPDADPLTWESAGVDLRIPDDSQMLLFMMFGELDDDAHVGDVVYADMARLIAGQSTPPSLFASNTTINEAHLLPGKVAVVKSAT